MNLISTFQGWRELYMGTVDSFNIFTEDVCITEQKIVLREKIRKQRNVTNARTKALTHSVLKWCFTLSSKMTLVPPYSGRRTFSPTFTLTGWKSPFWKRQGKRYEEVTPTAKHTANLILYLHRNTPCSSYVCYCSLDRCSPGWQSRVQLPPLWPATLCLETSLAAWCPPLLPSLLWSDPQAPGQTVEGIFWRPASDHTETGNSNFFKFMEHFQAHMDLLQSFTNANFYSTRIRVSHAYS